MLTCFVGKGRDIGYRKKKENIQVYQMIKNNVQEKTRHQIFQRIMIKDLFMTSISIRIPTPQVQSKK